MFTQLQHNLGLSFMEIERATGSKNGEDLISPHDFREYNAYHYYLWKDVALQFKAGSIDRCHRQNPNNFCFESFSFRYIGTSRSWII